MRFVYAFTLTCLLLLLVPAENWAQTRSRRSVTPKRSTSTATRSKGNAALALQDGRQRVGEKIKQISNFVYLYGRISKDFEAAVGTGGQPDATASALKNRLVAACRNPRRSRRVGTPFSPPRPNSNASPQTLRRASRPTPNSPPHQQAYSAGRPPEVINSLLTFAKCGNRDE